jgi:hypothetical protein
MRKSFLIIAVVLAFFISANCLGMSLMEMYIAYCVRETGQFHGIYTFQVGQSVRGAVELFLVACASFWAGLMLSRKRKAPLL